LRIASRLGRRLRLSFESRQRGRFRDRRRLEKLVKLRVYTGIHRFGIHPFAEAGESGQTVGHDVRRALGEATVDDSAEFHGRQAFQPREEN